MLPHTKLTNTDSSGIEVNFFSERVKGVTKRTHIPASNFVQAQTVIIDAAFKTPMTYLVRSIIFHEEVALLKRVSLPPYQVLKVAVLRRFRKMSR